ncbi:MAG: hypothetical protein ABF743_07210 [Schleiferilactobacillus perolens]|uniref:hypothetical protein n=1 Tax=Schleiferilactobacillus perolens TaxID=100468 RepID=UPI0039E89AE7
MNKEKSKSELKVVRIGSGYVTNNPGPSDGIELIDDIQAAYIDWNGASVTPEDTAERWGGEVVLLQEAHDDTTN